MNIKLPTHVVEFLQSKGFTGEPDSWFFQATALSDNRVYLSFSPQVAFSVSGSQWELMPMAKVALTLDDNTMLRGRAVNLTNIKGIGKMVWLFPDGSLQWLEGDNINISQASDGSTWDTLDTWCAALSKKERSIVTRLLGQRQLYTVMRTSLQNWGSQLKQQLFTGALVTKS